MPKIFGRGERMTDVALLSLFVGMLLCSMMIGYVLVMLAFLIGGRRA